MTTAATAPSEEATPGTKSPSTVGLGAVVLVFFMAICLSGILLNIALLVGSNGGWMHDLFLFWAGMIYLYCLQKMVFSMLHNV